MNFCKASLMFFLIIFNISSGDNGDTWHTVYQAPVNAWWAAATRVGQNMNWALLKNTPGNEFLRIYTADSLGQGSWSSLWTPATHRMNTANGEDDSNQKLPNGVYFCKLQVGKTRILKKVALLRVRDCMR